MGAAQFLCKWCAFGLLLWPGSYLVFDRRLDQLDLNRDQVSADQLDHFFRTT